MASSNARTFSQNSTSDNNNFANVLDKHGVDCRLFKPDVTAQEKQDPMAITPLNDWVKSICARLFKAKRIMTSESEAKGLFELLQEDNYPNYMRPLAEEWILKCSWTYKKHMVLTLDDFYPTTKNFEDYQNLLIFKEDIEMLIAQIRQIMKTEYRIEIARLKNDYEEKLLKQNFTNSFRNMTKMLLHINDLNIQIARQNDELKKYKSANEILETHNQKYRDEIKKLKEAISTHAA